MNHSRLCGINCSQMWVMHSDFRRLCHGCRAQVHKELSGIASHVQTTALMGAVLLLAHVPRVQGITAELCGKLADVRGNRVASGRAWS